MMNYQVLIADDEPLILQSLKGCLDWEGLGYSIVSVCSNGIMALEQARAYRPHIVLADVRMPGMSGLELMKIIGEELPGTQGIVISGYADFDYAREAIRHDARAYLLKPVDPDELTEALDRARKRLDQREPEDASAPEAVATLSEKLQNAIDYIDAHVRESISLNTVSRALFISPTYLCQLFRREMNTTFTQHLSEKKMALACELLRQSGATISEVAFALGYNDYFYFQRVFKKIVGQSPGSYQNAQKR